MLVTSRSTYGSESTVVLIQLRMPSPCSFIMKGISLWAALIVGSATLAIEKRSENIVIGYRTVDEVRLQPGMIAL